jgi:hypothetical protein
VISEQTRKSTTVIRCRQPVCSARASDLRLRPSASRSRRSVKEPIGRSRAGRASLRADELRGRIDDLTGKLAAAQEETEVASDRAEALQHGPTGWSSSERRQRRQQTRPVSRSAKRRRPPRTSCGPMMRGGGKVSGAAQGGVAGGMIILRPGRNVIGRIDRLSTDCCTEFARVLWLTFPLLSCASIWPATSTG